MSSQHATNYITYVDNDGTHRPRIGSLDTASGLITPLTYLSGTPLSNLYEVIEIGSDNIVATEHRVKLESVKILPPLGGRDVLAIGKNYAEHAKEFNASGYDASDKKDMPSHPVVFTKRATSIIAHGEEILTFPDFTSTLDYEGEIGVIIGKAGHHISESEASSYVWGYTIINDVTARERQRDHKQFYIGKSGDTFCPMGPIAVPVEHLPEVLKVQTRVNGELRQEGTTKDLIFSINFLIKTLSEAQTLRPGDVIATGTPAGVGFGLRPPKFLQPGDVVEISVSRLGTLRNRVADAHAANYVQARVAAASVVPTHNLTNGGLGLTTLNGKQLHVRTLGQATKPPVVFIHGLGGSCTNFFPLIKTLHLEASHHCILYDLEGQGSSPTKASSELSILSLTEDLHAIFQSSEYALSDGVTLIAHSIGCTVASNFARLNPTLVKDMVLINPTASHLDASEKRDFPSAGEIRTQGHVAMAEQIADSETSSKTKIDNPLAYTAVLQSVLSQDCEGYAKACALAAASTGTILAWKKVTCKTLVVTGDADAYGGIQWCDKLARRLSHGRMEVLEGVGGWALFEDVSGLSAVIGKFLGS